MTNPFVERLIGSIRRECLDYVLVLSDRHLRRILTRYFAYYHRARTHLSLEKDASDTRPIAGPAFGRRIIQFPEVGGLDHQSSGGRRKRVSQPGSPSQYATHCSAPE